MRTYDRLVHLSYVQHLHADLTLFRGYLYPYIRCSKFRAAIATRLKHIRFLVLNSTNTRLILLVQLSVYIPFSIPKFFSRIISFSHSFILPIYTCAFRTFQKLRVDGSTEFIDIWLKNKTREKYPSVITNKSTIWRSGFHTTN